MLDAKRKLEEELKRRRAAEAARLEEIERQKELELAREKEEQEKLVKWKIILLSPDVTTLLAN